jgi:hypothetical protein
LSHGIGGEGIGISRDGTVATARMPRTPIHGVVSC